MKKQTLAVAVALVISFVAAGKCHARPRVLQANIPFAFEVGDTRLPAGHYQIESVTTGAGTLQVLRELNGSGNVRLSTIAVEVRDGNSKPELVFHRYGNRYFLSQIWNGDGTGRQLVESKQQKEAARNGAAIELALSAR